jgi:asparagine synthase (glutamine-hydrolysing)
MERVLPAVTWHIEEPRVGQSYPNYCVARLASRFVKVCLAGTGGDELFGGYPWRYYRTVGATDFEDYVDRYYVFWQRLVANRDLRRMFSPVWDKVRHIWTRDIFRNVFGEKTHAPGTSEECVNRSLYFEAKTFLHGLLAVEDKLAMAHGLEIRVPFLDNDLVDFSQRLPVRFKLNKLHEVARISENEPGKMKQYFLKNNDGKQILRQTMERYIPPAVTDALKQGFSAPDASWFKGESIDYVRKTLYGKEVRIYDYMDRDAVRELVQEHLDGVSNRRLLIWSLLTFELWLRAYLP